MLARPVAVSPIINVVSALQTKCAVHASSLGWYNLTRIPVTGSMALSAVYLRLLQPWQDIARFSRSSVPPADRGVMCSTEKSLAVFAASSSPFKNVCANFAGGHAAVEMGFKPSSSRKV